MATFTPKPINITLTPTDAAGYTCPASAVTYARCVCLTIANENASVAYVRIYKLMSDGVTKYPIIPSGTAIGNPGSYQWTGSVILNANEKIQGSASVLTGVTLTGEAMEAS